MNYIDITDNLNEIKSQCKSTLLCSEYEFLGLKRTDCMNNAEDAAAALWGFSIKDMVLSADVWHHYNFSDFDEIEIKPKSNLLQSCIKIARSPLYYAISFSICFRNSGFGEPLTVWNTEQFLKKDHALEYGFEMFRKLCNERCSENDKSIVRDLINEADKIQCIYYPVQLSLF